MKCSGRKKLSFLLNHSRLGRVYLLVFLRSVRKEDALLHVAVQNLLDGRHVAFDDILHLRERQEQKQNKTMIR